MLKLPTVILEHTTRTGRHYDWLLADPTNPAGPLWTARTMVSPLHWMQAKCWDLEPIQPHRRAYLDYQGPISGGRGRVIQVDRGWFISRMWTEHRMVIDLHLSQAQGEICIQRLASSAWRANLSSSESADSDYLADNAGIDFV